MTRATGPNDPRDLHWQGRLSLQVQTTPVQAFTADFDLQGDVRVGTLSFFSPIGSTLARIQWDGTGAKLESSGERQQFESLDALTLHLTGAVLPVGSLFAWLQGETPPTPRWRVELGDLANGRLRAQRLAPETPAELKVILDR